MSGCKYTVYIDDNFHYMDESQRSNSGVFATFEEAVAKCKRLVEDELEDMRRQGVAPEELSATWALYGSDPFIVGGDERFSARDYVTEYLAKKLA
ncbi:MAG: hypothetical protein ACPGO3_10850 [Magnetospiraceae bacterium]